MFYQKPFSFRFLLLAMLFSFSLIAEASIINFQNGNATISASGYDGNASRDGDNAGNIEVTLSYSDSTKSAVRIEGHITNYRGNTPFSQIIPLASLERIYLYARGGDGGKGEDGTRGRDGNSGSNGSDGQDGRNGCPPGDGSNGSDGSDGSDGSNGTNGTNGGDGGNGGSIHINVAPDQTELLMLVTTSNYSGDGASGGSGGRGGSGGDGGRAGRGGSGGKNTCNPQGASGNDGTDGRNGRDGDDGRNGTDGNSGYDGSNGRSSITSGTNTYSKAYNLIIDAVKSIDANNDGVLEPGEDLTVTQMTLTNNGGMPTSLGQTLNLLFKNSSTLILKKTPASISVNEVIPVNGTKVLTFVSGELVFTAVKDRRYVGSAATMLANVAVNSVNYDESVNSSSAVRWPILVSSTTKQVSGYFGSNQVVNFKLQNLGTLELSPKSERGFVVEFAWNSPTIAATDVMMTIPDGRVFPLAHTVAISDLSLSDLSSMDFPVTLTIKNSAAQLQADGSLQMVTRLKDLNSDEINTLSSSATPIHQVMDLRPVKFDKTFDTKSANIECYFPQNKVFKNLNLAQFRIWKSINSDVINFQIYHKVLFKLKSSPNAPGAAFDFAPFYGLITKKGVDTKSLLDVLNTQVDAALQKVGDKDWIISAGSCKVK